MAKYSNTKAKINEKVTTNGRQGVSGSILNDVLQTMVDSLGADYQFGGLVQPGSSFTAGEQPVVFLATAPGTYTNFGGLVLADGEVALLVWSGSAWSKQTPDIATKTEVSQLGQKFGVFYTRGILEFSSSRSVKNTKNFTCKVASNIYTIPENTISDLSNMNSGTTTIWAIVFDTANLKFIAKAYSAVTLTDLIVASVEMNSSNNIEGITHCVTPYTLDGHYFSNSEINEINSRTIKNVYTLYKRAPLTINTQSKQIATGVGDLACVKPDGQTVFLSDYTLDYSSYQFASSNCVLRFNYDNSVLILEPYSSNNSQYPIIAKLVTTAGTNTIISAYDCAIPVEIDGVNYESSVSSLLKNRLVPVSTQGYVNCDNVNRKFVATKNIAFRFNGNTYTLLANTEINYNWNDGSTTLYKLCIDINSTPVTFKIERNDQDTLLPVLFTFYGTGSTSAGTCSLVKIITSVVNVKINGVDVDDKISSINKEIVHINKQLPANKMETYTGEHILIDGNKFSRKRIDVASQIDHSFASFGDYIVACEYSDSQTPSVVTAKIISNISGELLATLQLPYGNMHRPHCNVCCFGNEFGSANSIVPLLYVSQWDYEYERGVLVYDIKYNNGSYSADLVQTIVPDNIGSQYLGSGCVDWVVDTDNSMIYALAYYLAGPSTLVEGNKEMICKFELPTLSDGALVELTESDILDNWEMEMFNVSQDKCYNNGKIFVLSGNNPYPEWTKIRVIDLTRKEIVSVIPLGQYGGEPEGMDVVIGFLSYSYSSPNYYRLFL